MNKKVKIETFYKKKRIIRKSTIMIEIKGRYTNAFLTIEELEQEVINQVYRMANHIAFDKRIVVMPDGHAGKGSCIGFTMPMSRMIIPNVVSVDIGCGMLSANIGNKLTITLKELDDRIRRDVPMGINTHENAFRINSNERFSFEKCFSWEELNNELLAFVRAYNAKFGTNFTYSKYSYKDFSALCKKIGMKENRAELSIGTLGGGNHMIEVGRSEKTSNIWITIHSGSRNFGKMICEYHQEKAKKILDKNRNEVLKERIEEILKNTVDKTQIPSLMAEAKKELGLDFDFDIKGMEFLEGGAAFEYLIDMVVAQKYAQLNRKMMLTIICNILGEIKPIDVIESVHNFIDFRDFIIRKGAIRSYIGERMIIPLNMRDGVLVCEGKSNEDWNNSAPHGAGRLMSRGKAKESIDLDKFKKQMEGIYSTSVCKGTLDEAPDAYKDSKMIEAAIEPTATILDKLKPLLNIKDKNSGPTFKERKEAKKKDLERKAAREAANQVRMKSKYK
jgi:RNA-splicing ligase RtcB